VFSVLLKGQRENVLEDKEAISKLECRNTKLKFQQLKDVLVEKAITLVNGKTSQVFSNDFSVRSVTER